MYFIDYHTHSRLSPDGVVPLSQMADAAVSAGMAELCLTDHCDLMDVNGALTPDYDWAPGVAQFTAALPAYQGRLKLRLGLEYGVGHLNLAASAKILSQPMLDFVIGSVHNLSPGGGGTDFYFLDYDTPARCYRALDDYFASLSALAHSDCYDVLGHIIYPLRYMPHPVPLDGYMERIRDILKVVVQRGRGIEVNTWRGKTVVDWTPVLTLFQDCGGEFVTVGSDAHTPDGVGRGIAESYALLDALGFRYVTTYEKRKPVPIKL